MAYLRSLTAPSGEVRYSRTSRQTPVWVTAQAVAALARKTLPLARVPRAKPRGGRHAAAAAAAAPTATATPAKKVKVQSLPPVGDAAARRTAVPRSPPPPACPPSRRWWRR